MGSSVLLIQGMDRPGVWQVPEGSEEQGKMEKTGCKIVCGAPMTLAVKGLMMMMMMMMMMRRRLEWMTVGGYMLMARMLMLDDLRMETFILVVFK